jgi:hypothetical protein
MIRVLEVAEGYAQALRGHAEGNHTRLKKIPWKIEH